MMTFMATQSSPLDLILDPVTECLTPDVAKRLVDGRLPPKTDARISELAEKANEGLLSAQERLEYAAFVEALDVLAMLQLKARDVLTGRPA